MNRIKQNTICGDRIYDLDIISIMLNEIIKPASSVLVKNVCLKKIHLGGRVKMAEE